MNCVKTKRVLPYVNGCPVKCIGVLRTLSQPLHVVNNYVDKIKKRKIL